MGMNAAAVQRLYVAYFNRPADPISLAVYEAMLPTNNVATAAQLQVVAETYFSPSTEYTTNFDGLSNAQIVDKLYENIFGRSAEPAGLTAWAVALTDGTQTVASLALQLSYSAQGTDAAVVSNRIEAATAFTTALNTSDEITGYSGTAAAASAAAWLATVGSTEASKDTAIAGVDAAVAAAVAVGGVAGGDYRLTTGTDLFTGTDNNDTFTAAQLLANATWTVGDSIDGGDGNDSFNVTQTAAISTTALTGVSVKNVETATLTSGTTANVINASTWTGLTTLNVNGVTAQAVTAAATTDVNLTASTATGARTVTGGKDVTVTETGASGGTTGVTTAAGAIVVNSTTLAANGTTGNAITTTGGTTVNVTQAAGNAAGAGVTTTAGAVSITGGAATTAVTVSDTKAAAAAATVVGHVNGAVTIADASAASTTAAGTLATVTLASFATATIDSSAIATVNLSGTGTSLAVSRGALTATPTANVLDVNVNGLTLTGALTDGEAAADDGFTTVNIASSTTASTVGTMAIADATTLNISGDATFASGGETLTSITAINVTNTAGASLTTALGTGVTFTGGAGGDSISIGSTTKAITMGGGNDTVTTSSAAVGTGGSVDAGGGIADRIIMTDALAAGADGSAVFNSKFSGFEALQISDAFVENALDVEGLNDVSLVILASGVDGTAAINNIASGGTVQFLADGANTPALTIAVDSSVVSSTDSFRLQLTGADIAAGSVTLANVESITIDTTDPTTPIAADNGSITLVGTGATSLTVIGNNGLAITNTGNVALATMNASGVVGNSTATTTDSAANLAVSYTSTYTGAGAVSITGGAGNDTLTGAAAVDTITGGEGADTLDGKAGNDVLILTETTAAIDTVTFADKATNGVDTITGFAAGATGADLGLLVAAATTNNVLGAAGVADFGVSTNTTLTTGGNAFALTGANSTTDDIVEITATLSSQGDLDKAGVTSGTELLKALASTDTAAGSITATTANDDFYLVAYQDGKGFLYQVVNDNNTAVTAAEIFLVGVFDGVAANSFASGDFTI